MVANAAAALDPAGFPTFDLHGGDLTHAYTFYWEDIFKKRATRIDGGGEQEALAQARVAGSQAAHTRKKNDIMKEVKPADSSSKYKWWSEERWQQHLQERCQKLDKEYEAQNAGGVEAIVVLDPLGPLLEQLEKEIGYLKEEHASAVLRSADWNAKYGAPLASCTDAQERLRKAYWVTKKDNMPLLFRCACILLTAPAASTSNERVHSVTGRILSKYRSSMKPDNLNRCTMGYYWLRKSADTKAKELLAAGLSILDLDDAVELLPALDVVQDDEVQILLDAAPPAAAAENMALEGGGGAAGTI